MKQNMDLAKWNWKEFDPKQGQQDKRAREGAVSKAVSYVKNNFNQLGIASFVSVPLVDNNRSIKSFAHLYPPKSPLADFMENEENKKYVKKLEKALRETQLWAVELWEAKQEDDDKLFEMLGLGEDEETIENFTKDEAPKPAKPIFTMSTDEISAYHGLLLRYLYKKENISKYKLWAKKNKDGEVIEEATGMKAYDDTANKILPRNQFVGRGSGGANIGNKLKAVTAYLLQKLDKDHNKFFDEKPVDYVPVNINFDDPEAQNYPEVNTKGKKKNISKPTKKRILNSDESDDDLLPLSPKTPRP